jgi:hypothetical protein
VPRWPGGYAELVAAADQRHRDRLLEAKAALVDAQWAAAGAYNTAGSLPSATSALKAAMEAADAKYAAAVAESLWVRKRDLEEAWNARATGAPADNE